MAVDRGVVTNDGIPGSAQPPRFLADDAPLDFGREGAALPDELTDRPSLDPPEPTERGGVGRVEGCLIEDGRFCGRVGVDVCGAAGVGRRARGVPIALPSVDGVLVCGWPGVRGLEAGYRLSWIPCGYRERTSSRMRRVGNSRRGAAPGLSEAEASLACVRGRTGKLSCLFSNRRSRSISSQSVPDGDPERPATVGAVARALGDLGVSGRSTRHGEVATSSRRPAGRLLEPAGMEGLAVGVEVVKTERFVSSGRSVRRSTNGVTSPSDLVRPARP